MNSINKAKLDNKPSRIRESSGELIRLIAMLMIVAHHWVVHAMYPTILDDMDVANSTWDYSYFIGTHCFFFIGVNLFILISGWYSIKLKPRGFLNLYTICAAYALLYVLKKVVAHGPDVLNIYHILMVLLPFSHTNLWFIQCYVALMLLSPLLNSAIDSMSRKTYQWVLVLLAVISVWFGYIWQISFMNGTGSTTLQFITIYVLGGYLRRYCNFEWRLRNRWKLWWSYVGFSVLWGIIVLSVYWFPLADLLKFYSPFRYCNPLIIGASVSFFLFIMSFQFKSKIINWLAISCLAVYIVQETIFPYEWLGALTGSWAPITKILMLPILSLMFLLGVIMIDKIRILIMHPLWKLYDKKIDPALTRFIHSHSKSNTAIEQ